MSDFREQLAGARRSAEIARTLGVPLQIDPAEMLQLLDSIEKAIEQLHLFSAEIRTLRGQLDYCLETVGDAATAALERP